MITIPVVNRLDIIMYRSRSQCGGCNGTHTNSECYYAGDKRFQFHKISSFLLAQKIQTDSQSETADEHIVKAHLLSNVKN